MYHQSLQTHGCVFNRLSVFKMGKVGFVLGLLSVCCLSAVQAVECEYGWTIYKDEACIKVFDELLTYQDAKLLCASKGTGLAAATLVMVKDSTIQELLANHTDHIYDHMWLGGKYDLESGQFLWEDGEHLKFTNWADGFPRNDTESESCIQLNPVNSKNNPEGNWEDVSCQRRNVPICQRAVTWTIEDATREILKLRKRDLELQDQLDIANSDINDLRQKLKDAQIERNDLCQKLQDSQNEIQQVNARVVPVGSIYIEYFSQPSPSSLWPTLQWEDISSSYAGMFFRALGGNSANWGESQTECSPRISQIGYIESETFAGNISLSMPVSGWSDYIFAGYWLAGGSGSRHFREGLRFHVEPCETRPANQAIRIWRRSV